MKYIIEIADEDEQKYVNPINKELMIPKGFGKHEWEGSVNTGIMLTPYKESDTAEQAWELFKKLDAMSSNEWMECFENKYIPGCFGDMSYAEVKAKYDEWKKLKDELQIGDEVKHDKYGRCVLLEKRDLIGAELWHVIDETGKVCQINRRHIIGKTGRTFPEIVDLLEKMREPDEV